MNHRRLGIYGTGRTATELVAALRGGPHRISAAIVHSAHRAGKDFGDLTIGEPLGIEATSDLEGALRSEAFDVLLYAGLAGERHEHAMRGEHAVIDRLQIVLPDRGALAAHDRDQLVE